MIHLHWIALAMVGMTGLQFVMTTPESGSNGIVITPVGPEMCDHVCRHRTGCSGELYTPQELSCRLITARDSTGHLSLEGRYYFSASKGIQRLRGKRNLTCGSNAKIFYTRRNILKCRHSQQKLGRQIEYTRLLILPYGTKLHQGREVNLLHKTAIKYSYINIKRPTAVAYISTTRKLVISDEDSRNLYLVGLDATEKTIIMEGNYFSGIAVDENNHLVFLLSYSSKKIQVMTTEGKDFKTVTKIYSAPGQIAAHPGKHLVYIVIFARCIYKYTYKGEWLGTEEKGYISPSLVLDSKENILYYVKGYPTFSLVKRFLSNHTSFTIPTQFNPYPSFYLHSDTFYLTPMHRTKRQKLHVLSDSGKEITTINTGYGADVKYVLVCAIP